MISDAAKKKIEENKKNYIKYHELEKMDYAVMRKQYNRSVENFPMAKGTMWRKDCLNKVPVEWIYNAVGNKEKIILHVHGGGFVIGSPAGGRYMVSNVAARSGRNAVSVDYRLAPEYPYPTAVEDCIDVYKWLIENGNSASNIVFLGESAGATITLSMLAYCKAHGIPYPAAVCAIAPSVDHTFSSDSFKRNAEKEMVVNLNVKEETLKTYLRGIDVFDPVASPYYSDVEGWPPVYFQVDSTEILYDESVKMHKKLKESNVISELSITDGLFHTFQMTPLPESETAHQMIADFFLKYAK